LIATGDIFGRLKVEEFSHKNKWYKRFWKCRCECGSICIVIEKSLLKGETKSCGCLRKETRRDNGRTHGLSGTKLYGVWRNMLTRCEYTRCKSYKDYGARGIKVCDEWHNPEGFFQWAIGNGYREGLELDRINTNGGYCAENCRFIPRIDNAHNKRNNRFLTVNGETKTLAEWARETGCKYTTILTRLKTGMAPEKAIRSKKLISQII